MHWIFTPPCPPLFAATCCLVVVAVAWLASQFYRYSGNLNRSSKVSRSPFAWFPHHLSQSDVHFLDDGCQSLTPSHSSRIPVSLDAMNVESAATTFNGGVESVTASCPSKMGKMAMYSGKSRIPSLGHHSATMEELSDGSSQPSMGFSLCSDMESSKHGLPMNMGHADEDNVGSTNSDDMRNYCTITPTKMDGVNVSGYTYGSPSPINMDDARQESNLCNPGSPMWHGSAKKICFSPKDPGGSYPGQ